MSKELNCKWFFGPQSPGNEKGPNDPTEMSFKGSKYHSFIRESIQNSMDAVDDITKPVHVSFDYRQFSGMEYDLTKIFFSNNGMRTRRLGTGHIGRNREALKGILSFMKDNPDIFQTGLENRMIWITRHFNLIGGTLPLANKTCKYFYDELDKFKEYLTNIKNREQVTGPEAFI